MHSDSALYYQFGVAKAALYYAVCCDALRCVADAVLRYALSVVLRCIVLHVLHYVVLRCVAFR
jgi:hypothetical protein